MGFSSPWHFGGTLVSALFLTLWAATAFASQGPGAGPGTASPSAQMFMAIIVYGGIAAIMAAGLIRSFRQRL